MTMLRGVLLWALLGASLAERLEVEGVDYTLRGDIMEPVHKRSVRSLGAITHTNSSYLWPNGVVPWYIDTNISLADGERLSANDRRILWALAHIQEKTCIRFPRCEPPCSGPHVRFVVNQEHCSSYVGMQLDVVNQINVPWWCEAASIAHELLHALGLEHEQSRNDRDEHVFVDFDQIEHNMRGNFRKSGEDGRDVLPYDHESIMHYSPWGFAMGNERTIIAPRPIGQDFGLSKRDADALQFMYNKCTPFGAPVCVMSKKDDGPTLIPYGQNFTLEFNVVGRGEITVWYQNTNAPGVRTSIPIGSKVFEMGKTQLTFQPTAEHAGKNFTLAVTFVGQDNETTCEYKVHVVNATAMCGGIPANEPQVCSGRGKCVGGQRQPCECEQGWGGQFCEGPVECPADQLWNFDDVGTIPLSISGMGARGDYGDWKFLSPPYLMKPKWVSVYYANISAFPVENTIVVRKYRSTVCARFQFGHLVHDEQQFHKVSIGFDFHAGTADYYVDGKWVNVTRFGDAECLKGVDGIFLMDRAVWDDLHISCTDDIEVEGMRQLSVLRAQKGGHTITLKLNNGDEWVDTPEAKQAVLEAFKPLNTSIASGWHALHKQIIDNSSVTVMKNVLTIGPFRPVPEYNVEEKEHIIFVPPAEALKSGKWPLLRSADRVLTLLHLPTPTETLTATASHTTSHTVTMSLPLPPVASSSPDTVKLSVFLAVVIPVAVLALGLAIALGVVVYKMKAAKETPNAPDEV